MAAKQTPRVVRDRHEGKLSMPYLAEVVQVSKRAPSRRRKARKHRA